MPNEPSAFSLYNILAGPFASEAPPPSKRKPRDWEAANSFADGFGFNAPMQVGQQGRRKERDRLAARARELDDADNDAADWFNGRMERQRDRDRDRDSGSRRSGSGPAKSGSKIKFDFSHSSLDDRDRGEGSKRRDNADLPAPVRETESLHIRGAARKLSHGSTSSRDRGRDGDWHHDRYDRYDRDRDRRRDRDHQRGPRYKGGYSR